VDPLKFGLLFERFLSSDEIELPRIDIDFGKGCRDELIDYLKARYGDDCVALKMNIIELPVLDVIKDLDGEVIPLDDPETLGIFSRGDTDGVFLFESEGLKEHLKQMETLSFEDIVSLNVLYRPGPMDYIPEFIDFANGKRRPEYDLPEEEDILGMTHGVLVYQEQLMVLAERVAGFSPAEADRLRKAVCRRDRLVLEELHGLFIAGGIAGGHAKESLEAVWRRWTERGQLAFNRSHGVCYTLIGYRMAWMKAHPNPLL
jgi:DNA polymerase-3 subunit alpha